MSRLLRHRRYLAAVTLAMYCALAVGSHALHCWLGCAGGNCPPQVAGCPCGLPHLDEPIADEEVFTNDVALDRRHPVGPLGDTCGDEGPCSICQYHAQGQLAVDASIQVAIPLPARMLPRVGGLRSAAERPWESLPRGPPSQHVAV
ncbi:MAG: hypothetical protein JNM18_08065 [Planctomycetaceae bacterium]|nr:hypothetical protein [Planctomycetaceae bacterium]